jgi:hypothetical protein
MRNYIVIGTIALVLLVLTGCNKDIVKKNNNVMHTATDCATACAKIIPSESTPQITSAELTAGMYYGNLNQKKKGTPDNWVHILEGTRSATWCSPNTVKNYSSNCDCQK